MKRTGYEKHQIDLVEYQIFGEEYFTGCDIRLFFGDILVDEITNLTLTISERLEPIFGYASFTADAFVRGARRIGGSFSINFKDSYYLRSVIDRLGKKADLVGSEVRPWEDFGQPFTSNNIKWENPEDMKEQLNKIIDSGGIDDIAEIAKKYQEKIWGVREQGSAEWEPSFEGSNIPQNRDTFFYKRGYSNLNKYGFNILITYGNVNKKDNQPYTSNSIIGVQIGDMVKQINSATGEPVQEQYSFLAKDIDGDITRIPM